MSLHADSKEKADLQGALFWQEMLAAWLHGYLAARGLINIDLDRRESELSSAAAPKMEKTVSKSAFLNR